MNYLLSKNKIQEKDEGESRYFVGGGGQKNKSGNGGGDKTGVKVDVVEDAVVYSFLPFRALTCLAV